MVAGCVIVSALSCKYKLFHLFINRINIYFLVYMEPFTTLDPLNEFIKNNLWANHLGPFNEPWSTFWKRLLDWNIPSVISCYFYLFFFCLSGLFSWASLACCVYVRPSWTLCGQTRCSRRSRRWQRALPADAVISTLSSEKSRCAACRTETEEFIFHELSSIWTELVFMRQKMQKKVENRLMRLFCLFLALVTMFFVK